MSITSLTEWQMLDQLLDAKLERIALSGPPGIGKTLTPAKWATKNGAALFNVTLTQDTSVGELRGHFIVKGGDFVWHDGPLTAAWRLSHSQPVVVVINEITDASGAVLTFLHNYLDDRGVASLHLESGEIIRPGDVRVVATTNERFDMLPSALADRFPVRIYIKTPHPDAVAGLDQDLQPLTAEPVQLSLRALYAYMALRRSVGSSRAMALAPAVFGEKAASIVESLSATSI